METAITAAQSDMEIHHEELSDVTLYLATHRSQTLEDKRAEYDRLLRYAGKYHPITPETRMLEVGTGIGAVPILAKMNGLNLKGLEISPQLVEHARKWGAQLGVNPDIELNNLETVELGENCYDIIICSSVFEHVEHWEDGLAKVYRALKPGGVLFWESTNKFALKSGEYPPLFFYGWLPDWMRYRFRIWKQGPDIMKLGIDFHQFTFVGLRRAFRRVGFSKIYDIVDLADPKPTQTALKRGILNFARQSRIFREIFLFFFEGTTLVGVK
jgi:ubiquinone/menaquinone biosynthesis C-methylase UbiE